MYNYQIRDIRGDLIGVISLNSEEIPKNLVNGKDYHIGVVYEMPSKKVQEITLHPAAAYPADSVETALAYLWKIRMEAERTTVDDDPNAFVSLISHLAESGMAGVRTEAQKASERRFRGN